MLLRFTVENHRSLRDMMRSLASYGAPGAVRQAS